MSDDEELDCTIELSVRCGCGGASITAMQLGKTTYTCLECGKWVGTMTFELAAGAGVLEEEE